ncbi:hypothetical protein BKA83DRAFT_4055398, partial [Pisolithus microcarpus]
VAQVCIIFKLPDHLGSNPHPLAYVEWFTTLIHHDPITGLYVVSCSTCNCCPNVVVVGVDHFVHVCHLQAICGRQISMEWTSDSVLEKASSFHVNLYIDPDTFSALV